jgi:nucleoid-associated protein YgaU
MKKVVLVIIILIVGIGAGLGAGVLIINAKNKAVIADLKKSEASLQDRIRNYDNIVNQLTVQLQQANTEIQTLKTLAPAAAPAAEQTATAAAGNTKTAAAPADNSVTGETILYTIKSGDSLWSIAKSQLGNGNRVNDILKLNPKLTAKSSLTVGGKLNIPAK